MATGAVLWAMCTTTGNHERTEALFGAVFFETRPTLEGGVEASMGVADLGALGVLYLCVLVFCLLVMSVAAYLKSYRSKLLPHDLGPESTT